MPTREVPFTMRGEIATSPWKLDGSTVRSATGAKVATVATLDDFPLLNRDDPAEMAAAEESLRKTALVVESAVSLYALLVAVACQVEATPAAQQPYLRKTLDHARRVIARLMGHEEPVAAPAPRVVTGPRCEPSDECGRPGCPECQQ